MKKSLMLFLSTLIFSCLLLSPPPAIAGPESWPKVWYSDVNLTIGILNPYSDAYHATWDGNNGEKYAVDFLGSEGTELFSPVNGRIVCSNLYSETTISTSCANGHGGYGYHVIVEPDGDSANTFIMAHLHEKSKTLPLFAQSNGTYRISFGELVAYLGNTGNSTAPHLHFELRGRFKTERDNINLFGLNASHFQNRAYIAGSFSRNTTPTPTPTTGSIYISTTSIKSGKVGEHYKERIYYDIQRGSDVNGYEVSGNFPEGLSVVISGGQVHIEGNPSKGGDFNFVLTLKNSEGSDSKNYSLHIEGSGGVTDKESIYISTETLKEGKTGEHYKERIYYDIKDGDDVNGYEVSGNFPEGLSITINGGQVHIEGDPKYGDTYSFSLKLKNSVGYGSRNFTLKIEGARKPDDPPVREPFVFDSNTYYDGITGQPYSGTITVNGGASPYKWEYSGNIPKGLNLSFSDNKAVLSGTPENAEAYIFSIKVTDSDGKILIKNYIITITKTELFGTLSNGIKGTLYKEALSAHGGTVPYTWTILDGKLPDGLTLNASTGEITGRPTKKGSFNFTVEVKDNNGVTAKKAFTVKVTQTTLTLTVPTTIIRGKSYTWTPKVSGGTSAYKWSISKGKLPDGLSINASTGKITGKPTKAGTFNFTVKVTDKNNIAATKAFTVKVTQTTLTLTVPATIIRGKSYTWTPKVTGGTSAYKWTISKGKLPDGLSINASTGKITGKPTKAGTFNFTVKVTDKNNIAATKAFTVKVTQTTLTLTVPTTIIREKSYTWTPKVSGGTSAYKWTISKGKLPNGLSINSSTGKITGKPSKAGTFNFTVKVTDKNNVAATKAFTVKVTQTTLNLTVSATIIRGKSYTWTPKVSGGTSAYKWSISKGKLPDGLSINSSTGKITGKPTKAGTFNFTVKVTDKNNVAATKAFTVKVTQTTLNLTVPATIIRGKSYTWTPKVTGGTSAYTWTISKGSLPTGMKINASTGKITGKPTKTGSFSFTVKAKDKNSIAATKAFTVKVTESASTTAQAVKSKTTTQFETDTSINGLKSSIPVTLQTETLTGIQGNGTINLFATLSVESDDVVEAYEGKDSDLVKVKAGKDLTFIVGDWGVDVSNVTVYVNENALEGITLEDNKFTLPPEIVHDDFKVSVKAQSESGKLESEEVYVISE